MTIALVIAAFIVTLATVGYFFFGRHSDRAASHEIVDRHGSQLYGGGSEGPADAGAEADGVAGRGEIVPGPGPSAESEAKRHTT